MKKIEKKLYRFVLVGAVILGGLLSIIPSNISAGELFNRIPCHSDGIQVSGHSYVDCSTCTRIEDWSDNGNPGRCKPSVE